MPFVPLNEPDLASGIGGPAADRWYVVRRSDLAVTGGGTVPTGPAPSGPFDVEPLFIGLLDGARCWAVGTTATIPPLPGGAGPDDEPTWAPLMALGSTLPADEWTAAGRAVQLVEWVRTSHFCGRCATATVSATGERAMRCPACGLLAYPRLAPAVIVLIRRGDEALLARNGRFGGRMFSTVAGFVEPGETLEETVHREVAEEVGVRLSEVRYVASQPWPFPHSLMLGFEADWAGGEIHVDGEEIVEAAWFGRDDLPMIPPPLSIARQLIDGWLLAPPRP